MTRLLIIGNSHAGALKKGDEAFRLAFPGVETGYFAAPGAIFLRARVDDTGRFSTLARNKATLKMILQINGALDCNLNDWDQVLVIGHRPRFTGVTALLDRHDLLEGSRTGKPHTFSWALMTAAARAQIEAFVRAITSRFRPNRNVTFFAGPFVAASIVERAATYPLAQAVANHLDHPDLPEIFDWWVTECEAAVTAAGFGFLRQPESTLSGPGLTASHFAIPEEVDGSPSATKIDHRHMNGEFGLAVLSAFAQARLGLAPTQRPNPSIQEMQQ